MPERLFLNDKSIALFMGINYGKCDFLYRIGLSMAFLISLTNSLCRQICTMDTLPFQAGLAIHVLFNESTLNVYLRKKLVAPTCRKRIEKTFMFYNRAHRRFIF
jgi:hypothetical protein